MQTSHTITFGILTISDRCFVNKAIDESGSALEKCLKEAKNLSCCRIEARGCVPDKADIIESVLKIWSDEMDIHVILTTGGTGLSPRDVTPEATRHVIDKEAPGVALAMAKGSLDKTPMAMLSRAVCGIRKQTLIINLPGSKKGAVECLGFIIKCIPHAVALIRDQLHHVQQVHSSMQAGDHSSIVDVSHVARRLRNSPYPMISYDESIYIIDKVILGITKTTKEISVRDALGYVLAKEVLAEDNLPPFQASMKDGYAVLTKDGEGVRKVIAESSAGSQPTKWSLSFGECIRINTGAPVPVGADAVVQVENTKLIAEADDGRRELEIEILFAPKINQDIRAVGSDISKGQTIAAVSGIPLTSQDLGLFAAAGVQTVQVYRRPIIAMFSTGNELQEPGNKLMPGHVWDSNRIMLSSLFQESGSDVVDLGIVRDEPNKLLTVLKAALNCSDIVVTTGSVSMGDKDMLKLILQSDLNAHIYFGRVNLKPGKPTTFATCKSSDGRTKVIFCLPGNPVSAYVTCHLYVLRAVKFLSGYSQVNLTPIYAMYEGDHVRDEREEFRRGIVTWCDEGAVVQGVGGCMLSSNLLSCQSANCLIRIPPRTETMPAVQKDMHVECLMTGKL